MNWEGIDWQALERMRTRFLAGTAGAADYWQNESDLASYDATFAQRIGWKWDYVLDELTRRNWTPPRGVVLDWGCGSGIASRAVLDHFGTKFALELRLADRSALAMNFAAKRAREKYSGLATNIGSVENPALLLLSHVLTELSSEQLQSLLTLAQNATSVIWIEPGTHDASHHLIEIREQLRSHFNVVAPCTHQFVCGMRAPGNERHWCHHFAAPPPKVFMDGNWARFANLVGIDLRDLPLSFLVLDRRPANSPPPGTVRIIGHPRVYKAHALLFGCDESGVRDRNLPRANAPELFRKIKKGRSPSTMILESSADKIQKATPWPDDEAKER